MSSVPIVYPDGLSEECKPAWLKVCDLDREGVIREFKKNLEDRIEAVKHHSVLIVRAGQLGISPEEFRIPDVDWVRIVAWGRLMAVHTARYLGRDRLLRWMTTVPLATQKQLAADPRIKVAFLNDGVPDFEVVELGRLNKNQMAIALRDGGLADDGEQLRRLREEKQPPRRRKRKEITVDVVRGLVIIDGIEYPPEILAEKLADLGWVCKRKRIRASFGT